MDIIISRDSPRNSSGSVVMGDECSGMSVDSDSNDARDKTIGLTNAGLIRAIWRSLQMLLPPRWQNLNKKSTSIQPGSANFSRKHLVNGRCNLTKLPTKPVYLLKF